MIFDRSLSWINFNERVIFEAERGRSPLLERAGFLAIATSNLDEFFMVRVPKVEAKDGVKPLIHPIKKMVEKQYKQYNNLIEDLKKEADIEIKSYASLKGEEKKLTEKYFKEMILPVLEPIETNVFNPLPNFRSGTIIILVDLESKEDGEEKIVVIEINSNLERLFKVSPKRNHFILIENIISENLHEVFEDFHIKETVTFRITRDEHFEILEELDEKEDIADTVMKELKERANGEIVRVEYENKMSTHMREFVLKNLNNDVNEFYEIDGPLALDFLWTIQKLPNLEEFKYPALEERFYKKMGDEQVFDLLKKKDKLLIHPFDSFDMVSQVLMTAANDPDVFAIKHILYRVKHGSSPIINALVKAAQNGKQVTVFIEAKARFDEEDNIVWAQTLEKAGCNIIYGVKDLKVHGKVYLILRKEEDKIMKYVHLGTGNYSKSPYVDMCLFTSNPLITEDIANVFLNLTSPQKRNKWKVLGVGPKQLEKKFISLVEREIENAKKGKKACIMGKMNGLTDKDMIKRLYEASEAGVKVILIVRGPSCLVPGLKGKSENIEVYSIVGRFLEHNRVYSFYNNGDIEYFLSSADWMTRNLERRVEIMFPILSEENKESLELYFKNILKDNTKRWEEKNDGSYELVKKKKDEEVFIYQDYYLENKL